MKTSHWLVLAVIVIAVVMRLTVYGDLRLSIANADTRSYVESSRVNLLSWEALTTYRPFTTNLIYKILIPGDYDRTASTGESDTTHRRISAGFKDIAALQSFISIVGWGILAWVFSFELKNGIIRVASAAMIMGFGFTPDRKSVV